MYKLGGTRRCRWRGANVTDPLTRLNIFIYYSGVGIIYLVLWPWDLSGCIIIASTVTSLGSLNWSFARPASLSNPSVYRSVGGNHISTKNSAASAESRDDLVDGPGAALCVCVFFLSAPRGFIYLYLSGKLRLLFAQRPHIRQIMSPLGAELYSGGSRLGLIVRII